MIIIILSMENNELLRRAEDLRDRCERSAILTATAFLTPAEQRELEQWAAPRGEPRLVFFGGGPDCERRCGFFLPDYLTGEDIPDQEKIGCVAYQSFFGRPGHRDYLGAALGLGIRREWLGDIRLSGDRCWIFCLKTVEELLLSLDRVGRITVKGENCPLPEVPAEERKTEERTFTVQSLRLDAVAAGLFRLSRTAAAEQIRLGLVSLNYEPCLRPDAVIREGDVISLRGKGKGSVKEIGGRSKKDRLFITAERRL